MTVRGVGPPVALTYGAPVDVLARFRRSKSVGAVFGLTPSRDQSGETDRPGRHIAVRGRDDADHVLRSGPEHAGCKDGPTQGLGDEDPPASRHEKSDRRAGTPASSEGRGLAWSVTRRSYATRNPLSRDRRFKSSSKRCRSLFSPGRAVAALWLYDVKPFLFPLAQVGEMRRCTTQRPGIRIALLNQLVEAGYRLLAVCSA
jgi:transposase IS116/IS110/IS902 family protein